MERDSQLFERTFREHHDAVLAYARRRASDDDARDVVAETFLVAWRRFDDVPRGSELPWLYGVARRVLANQRRGAGRRAALVERLGTTAAEPAAHVPAAGSSDGALAAALARLSESDREILLLVAWEGLGNDDGARALGCRPATFRMRLHRARRRLAALLDEPAERVTARPSIEVTS